MLLVWGAVAVGTWAAMPQLLAFSSTVTTTPEQRAAVERSVYYGNCDAARAAGTAPIYRGQAGYREGLDGDFDGIACEPYRY
ncbi:excalibur calcium-binding domain-containing protein [Sphingomonas sp. JC676]|uniref:excalibur calcium-binding domain-containing protein n=1 Tax=Sphingomonas sp. JC676 TaxID=2768065 RepID=UPI00292A5B90|nr:excalibur calcium-binding domain-containing protein [Sphingomonas sp. JC676]